MEGKWHRLVCLSLGFLTCLSHHASLAALNACVAWLKRHCEAARVGTHPSCRLWVCVGVCVCDGLDRKGSITLHIGQTIDSLPAVFLISATATMTLLLSALGVLLCSLLSSSDVLPQEDFNLQMVSQERLWSSRILLYFRVIPALPPTILCTIWLIALMIVLLILYECTLNTYK